MSESSIADLASEASRLHRIGRSNDAQAVCHRILAREPAHVPSLNLLGLAAQLSGDQRAALTMFKKAIAADDFNAACHYNAGNSYQRLGNRAKAAVHFDRALALGMDEKAVALILQSPLVAAYIARIAANWPLTIATADLFGTESVFPLADDLLLRCSMNQLTLSNMWLELLLSHARSELLRLATERSAKPDPVDRELLAFACALAKQCFVNEYVYGQSEAEREVASKVRERLLRDIQSGNAPDLLTLAVVAAYYPLHTVPMREALLKRVWPAPIIDLLRVQVREPIEDLNDRESMAELTPIKDRVSVEVMHQYEANPYPRWTINPLNAFVADRTRKKVAVSVEDGPVGEEILIAGCGTGSHAIQIAQLYPNARLLAVDISKTSLAYARRKTRELNLHNVDYAQADILELGKIDRRFDSIESVGVLHHLADPAAGWRVLISLLRQGGRMRIGLYSDLARRVIVQARSHIAAQGYRPTPEDIINCRRDMFRDRDRWHMLTSMRDFYSVSGCRDLLFNVMEHRFTIPQIRLFLNENGLTFLGFEPFDDPTVTQKFHGRFRNAADETNLDQWTLFEADHPDTFWGMYVFTITKST